MKNLARILLVLSLVAVLMAVWSPWMWESIISAVILVIAGVGVMGPIGPEQKD